MVKHKSNRRKDKIINFLWLFFVLYLHGDCKLYSNLW